MHSSARSGYFFTITTITIFTSSQNTGGIGKFRHKKLLLQTKNVYSKRMRAVEKFVMFLSTNCLYIYVICNFMCGAISSDRHAFEENAS